MLENQNKIIPLLIEDLGMICATNTSKQKTRFGVYQCYCGNTFKVNSASVKSGNTKSCGCLNKNSRIRSTTHGLSKHPIYRVWNDMIRRTSNPKCKAFKEYGARGITVCDEWKDVNNFIKDMESTYVKGLSLDRENNNLGYSFENCRWITRNIQVRNTRVIRANNTSGYRGVFWGKSINKWRVQIYLNGKSKHLGCFDDILEAARTYDKYVIDNNFEHNTNGVYVP